MVSDGDGLRPGGLRRHDLGGQTPEQLDELPVCRDRMEQLRGLNDHIIERLFAAGLDLQGTIARCRSPEVRQRLARTVDDLQSTSKKSAPLSSSGSFLARSAATFGNEFKTRSAR